MMDASKVNQFLARHAEKFPMEALPMLKERLLSLDESKEYLLYAPNVKDPHLALALSCAFLLGVSGLDRMYIGDMGLSVGKLLTAGGCGIWAIIDLFRIMDATKEKNLDAFLSLISL